MRSARLQYALLLVVAAASLTCFFASAIAALDQIYDSKAVRPPLSFGSRLNVLSASSPESYQAGVRTGDPILAINGRPFTGYIVLLEELRKTSPGGTLNVTFTPSPPPAGTPQILDAANINRLGHPELSQPAPPRTAAIYLQRATPVRAAFLHLLADPYFLIILFPFGCLLLAFWVVASRPRDKNAWFLLGILVYFAGIFGRNDYWGGPLYSLTTFWSQVVQLLGPLSIMLLGLYFPERAKLDQRLPWIKWVMVAAIAALAPINFALSYSIGFDFTAIPWNQSFISRYRLAENLVFMVAISLYFFALATKLSTATRPDLRRRLQILYWGSTFGNLPFFLIVVYSMIRGREFGDGLPSWLFLAALLIFTLFPISLAYVVVVHRAMELRVLLRQGTKYALARTSIWILRSSIALGLYFTINHLLSHRPFHHLDEVEVASLIGLFLVFRFRAASRLSLWIDRRFFREAYSSEQVLDDLATQAQTFTDTQALMQTVSTCISGALHVERIAIFIRSGDVFRLQLASGIEIGPDLMLSANSETISNLTRRNAPTSGRHDDPDAWSLATTEAERAALLTLGAEILIPLPGRNRLIGVLALGPKRSEEPYTRSDRILLQSVALHTGLAIENSELVRSLASEAAHREHLNRELEIAREVQERMLPQSLPLVPGVDFAGCCRPALGVGGDYYDFFELTARSAAPRSLGLAIGDVSGKGISAALLMASLRASLRAMTRTSGEDLAAIMRDVNQLVYEASASNRYATFFYAQYDPRQRLLSYVNAGHNPPVLLRSSASPGHQISRLEACGPVVGLLPDCDYQQRDLPIEHGDILLAFTDGVSESMAVNEEEWGEDRMVECLQQNARLPAATLIERLLEEATLFAAGAPQYDDMTLLLFKFTA